MKTLSIKNKTTAFSILLIATIAISMLALPNFALAGDYDVVTYPFIESIPNPIGVGQTTLINLGLLNFLNADGDGWNVTLLITDPNNETTTIGPLTTWSTGTVGYSFTPDTVGTYKLQCHFDATWYNYTGFSYATWSYVYNAGYYLESDSDVYELVVQEAAVTTYPSHALPTEYWSRPIDSQLREWYSVSGSWVTTPANLLAEYNDAPETAHILWTTAIGDTFGGLAGGDTGEHGYGTGDAYEGKFASSVIISGVLYYNKYGSYFYGNSPQQEIVAIDLHTGEQLWARSYSLGDGRLDFGQTLYWDCLNYRGAFSYIWIVDGTNWYGLDASTGDLRYNMTNVPSGTTYRGENGEILQYSIVNYGNITNPNYHLLRWNSSYVVTKGKTGMSESWGSQTQGMTYDATARGYDLNVSISNSLTSYSIIRAFPGNRIILGNVSASGVTLIGLSLVSGSEGTLLFSQTNAAPSTEWNDITVTGSIGQAGWTAFSIDDMIATYWTKENRVNYAYSLETGEFLWETAPQIYSDAWSDTVTLSYGPEKVIAYGNFYSASVGGVVYCYNASTGALKWTYNAADIYTESYLGNNWWIIPLFVSDGKIYFGSLEHSALDPKPRGAPFFCLDAETGDLVFEIDGAFRQTRWGGRALIGDSIIATQDTYNQQIYGVGKGASQTTVTSMTSAVAHDTPVIISGSVLDISPGTSDSSITLRFPNGVPAVSDASMSAWMLYVYKQFEQPMNATGVAVSIDAVDPNGNYVHLGDATTDSSGHYSLVVTPQNTGTYTVYVTFAGTNGYYGSFAETTVAVQEAAQATATPTPIANPPYELYTIGSAVAIIVALAVAVLLLRKKP
jgi:outer membrane protein assembly factor BamB